MAEINYPVDLATYTAVLKNNPCSKNTDWELNCYLNVKAHIRNHYSIIQEDKCCYCKISLRHGAYAEPIEHIVPRADVPEWMFTPKNLALSCSPCNTKKKAKNTLTPIAVGRKKYPKRENGFLIFHPHFNRWDQHFVEFRKYFILPKSQKGRETCRVCDLYRLNLPLDKAK